MNKIGIGNDQFQSFLSDIYKRSVELGSTPQSIASYLRDLLEFSQYFGSVPNTCLSGTKEARKRSAREEVTRFVCRDIYASKAKI